MNLNGPAGIKIVVVGLQIGFELVAVTKYHQASLLKTHVHVLWLCRANIVPNSDLFVLAGSLQGIYPSGVKFSYSPSLGIFNLFFAHCPAKILCELLNR